MMILLGNCSRSRSNAPVESFKSKMARRCKSKEFFHLKISDQKWILQELESHFKSSAQQIFAGFESNPTSSTNHYKRLPSECHFTLFLRFSSSIDDSWTNYEMILSERKHFNILCSWTFRIYCLSINSLQHCCDDNIPKITIANGQWLSEPLAHVFFRLPLGQFWQRRWLMNSDDSILNNIFSTRNQSLEPFNAKSMSLYGRNRNNLLFLIEKLKWISRNESHCHCQSQCRLADNVFA